MNKADYNYLASEIKKAEGYLKFFEGVKMVTIPMKLIFGKVT